jgi:dTDP-4-amino-4,6-dideoxygalactose transaminase
MAVPLLDLAAHHESLHTKIMAVIEQVFHSQAFSLGPEMSKLEERAASYCQTRSAISRYDGRHSEAEKVPWVAAEGGS